MNNEERTTGTEPKSTPPAPRGGRQPVFVYIMILFIAAFLLMALSFMMHQRSNTEALGALQNSFSSMQEIQTVQEKVISLQDELQQKDEELASLKDNLSAQEKKTAEEQDKAYALQCLYELQQQYLTQSYDGCRATLQQMENSHLVELLPKTAGEGITTPYVRYAQLKEAILNRDIVSEPAPSEDSTAEAQN